MNIDFEAALRYIDLGSYEKAIASLKSAISKEIENDNKSDATQYRCVLGELYANLGKKEESRKEFEQVIDFCDETNTLQKQHAIAAAYIDAFNGKIIAEPAPAAKRPGYISLVPKPQQDKGFIQRQSRRNRK